MTLLITHNGQRFGLKIIMKKIQGVVNHLNTHINTINNQYL